MSFPFQLVDLTHTLTVEAPSWNGSCGFSHDIKLNYENSTTEVKFRVQQIKMHAGIGTHVDAPAHCIPGGKCIADLTLNELIAPCVMIDVTDKAHARYSVTIDDITAFETQYGPIPSGSLVIFHTGWERFWTTPNEYRNQYFYPSVSKAVAELLLQRNVVGLAIDTLSPDRPSDGFPVHQLILGAGKYIVENIANAIKLPATGAYCLTLPIKTQDGTEAPARLVGCIPK